ncbi:hypothetical protein RJT34_32255 [Clitoria ternatea]|uniref:Uncharacterized protein n=1 Tax=Clitoria ternatea TaxID=43366 RepID=A0AAN9EXY8_CLITE
MLLWGVGSISLSYLSLPPSSSLTQQTARKDNFPSFWGFAFVFVSSITFRSEVPRRSPFSQRRSRFSLVAAFSIRSISRLRRFWIHSSPSPLSCSSSDSNSPLISV